MKILYVAPRYHTNQIPVMEGWLKNGHQVVFVSQVTNDSEDHSALTPIVLGYSGLFLFFFDIDNKIQKRTLQDDRFAVSSKRGFPPYRKLKRIISEFEPDIAILRERSVYTAMAFNICKKYHIPAILYNQSPYWDTQDVRKSRIKKWTAPFFPEIRMTPVLGVRGNGKIHYDRAYYVPFVMEPYASIQEKEHFLDDKIQVICVAGYHDRKRLPLLLDAIERLQRTYPVHLSIVGEVITENQEKYFHYIEQYISERKLCDVVTLYQNYKRRQIFEQYKKSDLFVLPSTRERASISQLEAMSCSLPVICSDTNGSACQVENDRNGYLFRDESLEDLTEKIEKAIRDRNKLVEMGQASYKMVLHQYSFEIYQKSILQILHDIKGR